VQESQTEHFRVRRCTIYFYLEDDTVQVNESQVVNSGIPQGELALPMHCLLAASRVCPVQEP